MKPRRKISSPPSVQCASAVNNFSPFITRIHAQKIHNLRKRTCGLPTTPQRFTLSLAWARPNLASAHFVFPNVKTVGNTRNTK